LPDKFRTSCLRCADSRASFPARREVATPMLSQRWRRSTPIQAPCRQTCLRGKGFTKVFLKLWRSTVPPALSNSFAVEPKNAAERNLEAITPLPRQTFLLRTVDGFSVQEIAAILDRPPGAVTDLITQAGREIAQQVATDILIIEDEPIIALDIETMVQELGHRVTGIARTHKEAIASARVQEPGLVLADIHLADGSSGLAAVNEILTSINVPVIFITAYPERLLTGEKPEPAFLITKPFQADTVRATISQALFFDRRAGRSAVAADVGERR
jgi:CheY-like chemotaxis protein